MKNELNIQKETRSIYDKYCNIIKRPVPGQTNAWAYNREHARNCAIAEVDAILDLPQLDSITYEFYSKIKIELETYNRSGYDNIF